MGEALCKCVSGKAQDELSEEGYDFLVAMLSENESETERLRTTMPMAEVVKAGMFMTNAPATCASEGS